MRVGSRPSLWLTLALCFWASSSAAQVSSNVTLLGQLNQYSQYNDVWGYTDEFGNEYALAGTTTGTSVVNVTDPTSPYETGFIPGAVSTWRDMKTYDDYAYIVSEGGGGMQIVDLTDPENPQELAPYLGFTTAHNIYIEAATARAYPCGMNVGGGGFLILDLTNPTAPTQLGIHSAPYVHDLYVEDNIAYVAEINDGTFSIIDVNTPSTPVLLGGPVSYPGSFTHNTWLSDDGSYLLTTDENLGGRVRIWDIQNLLNIQQVGEYQAPQSNSIIHNVTVRENLVHISYYTEGYRVVDITDPTAPAEVGYYDTWAGASGGFNGAWGVYPFFPSGTIAVADIQSGLVLVSVAGGGARLGGTVTEDGVGTPVEDVAVELVATNSTLTSPSGTYTLFADEGTYTLRATKEGFYDHTQSVVLLDCCPQTVDVSLVRRPTAILSGTIRGDDTSKAIVALEAATIALQGSSQKTNTDGSGNYSLPLVPIGGYNVRVTRPGFGSVDLIVDVPEGGKTLDLTLSAAVWYDNADTDQGWTLSDPDDSAVTGQWTRAVPVPSGGGSVQPGTDTSPPVSSGICFVTQNAPNPGDSIGANDIDGGKTTLTTPTLDMSGLGDPYVAYSRWYVNAAGANPGTDIFEVEISNDDGDTWSELETVEFDATPWTRVVFRVNDVLTPTNLMKVRFVASDFGGGSVVEAGIDDFEFFGATATATEPPSPPTPRVTLAAFPNPFNPRTTVRFELAQPGPVRLTVHDVRGRRITTLLDGPLLPGRYDEVWDGRDDAGRVVSSGTYLAVLRTLGFATSHKLLLAK